MSKSTPRVSIGLPVYNGEDFLEETLISILSQTYSDFELVISDNLSTDGTEEICLFYAKQDSRIKYHRQVDNLGASANFNFVFEASRGDFFKWAAHDDLLAPVYLERCMEVFEKRDDVVLVFTRTKEINETGKVTHTYPSQGQVDSDSDSQRFRTIIVGHQPFIPVFGVVRRKVLASTKLIGNYSGSDRPLIGELALRGNLYEIPEFLWFYRVHEQQSWGGDKSWRAQQAWYDPSRLGKRTYPAWRLLLEHERAIWRVPMGTKHRLKMHQVMLRWMRSRWRMLLADLSG